MNILRSQIFLLIPICAGISFAADIRLDCRGFVDAALSVDPIITEQNYSSSVKRAKVDAIKAEALLPKLQLDMAFGPTPGLQEGIGEYGDTIQKWDFTKIGPYFGTEFKVAQPLNYGRLRTGLRAARADLEQKEWEIQTQRIKKIAEYQQYYFGLLLAQELSNLALDASRQLQKAEDRIQDELNKAEEDEEFESKVTQDDLLEIKAGRYEIDKAVADADNALRKVDLAIRFSLSLEPTDRFIPLDSSLTQRLDLIPSLDTLKTWLHSVNPELHRVKAGIRALNGALQLQEAKLGPDFFIFGSFKYAKSWAGSRTTLSQNAFLRDPVNTISGSLGVGLRYNLNFWYTLENVKLARIELRQLKFKDAYAANGLEVQLEIQYNDWVASRNKLESVRKSLRATEALLKAVALRFDVDPSEGNKLVNAYKRNLLMQKDYYYAIYQYNIAVADLLAKVGFSLAEFPRIQL